MQNPAFIEYYRTRKLAAVFVIFLSLLAAFVHFLMTVDNRLQQTDQRLQYKAAQLDSQLTPLLQFSDWLSILALSGQAEWQTSVPLTLYNHAGTALSLEQLQLTATSVDAEVRMLQHLALAFSAVQILLPAAERIVYVSEQDFLYISPEQFSLLQLQALSPWFAKRDKGSWQENVDLQTTALENNKLVLSRRIKHASGNIGYILFVLDVSLLLQSLQKQTPTADFLLLDDSGQLLGGTSKAGTVPEELLLQLQRIGKQPFSLVMLEHRGGLFNEGLSSFIVYWLSYLLVLAVAVAAFLYRLKQKIVSPVGRLTIHVERMLREQGGVRHIPSGWEEMFDKIGRLKP